MKKPNSKILMRLFALTMFTGLPFTCKILAATFFDEVLTVPNNLFFQLLGYANNVFTLVLCAYLVWVMMYITKEAKKQELKEKFSFFKNHKEMEN